MKLNFDNSFAQLDPCFYQFISPTPVARPELLHVNHSVAALLDIACHDGNQAQFAAYFSGNQSLTGSQPLASVYAGHQFGYYVPRLGDGRALLLGEVVNHHQQRLDIQLKGAGLTPYSRMGDGRAVLRSTIREYLCSEAMHALGIPTTRALCLVATNEAVYRETVEPGAILTRVATSLIRFGHFEYFYYTKQHGALRQLADYVLNRHYPNHKDTANGMTNYHFLFQQAVLKTAQLIAQWQAYGFCHGVMNTDNMSIIGLTIDYGPFGFLDKFNPHHICNQSDTHGRYAYQQQPAIAYWNLQALANAFMPLVAIDQLQQSLDLFESEYSQHYLNLMRLKLGLTKQLPGDKTLIKSLMDLLTNYQVDYTNFFRLLSTDDLNPIHLENKLNVPEHALHDWFARYTQRLSEEPIIAHNVRQQQMNGINPCYILRNHLAQEVIEQAYNKNYSKLDRLYQLLKNPYQENANHHHFTTPPSENYRNMAISCSS